jgi:hypothetical protein
LAPIIYRENGPRKGHVKRYAEFIPGHGYKDWGKRMKARPPGTTDRVPLGAIRVHRSTKNLVYWLIKIKPGTDGWRFQHRVIMEKHLNRQLNSKEHVHHKNENTLDNRLENLQVMSHSEHSKHHGAQHGWSLKHDKCIVCDTTERYHEGLGQCTACYQRTKYHLRFGAG